MPGWEGGRWHCGGRWQFEERVGEEAGGWMRYFGGKYTVMRTG